MKVGLFWSLMIHLCKELPAALREQSRERLGAVTDGIGCAAIPDEFVLLDKRPAAKKIGEVNF
jgi:hypothetical protein